MSPPTSDRICEICGDYILDDESYIHTNPIVCWAIFKYLRHTPYPEDELNAELARIRAEYAWGQARWDCEYQDFRDDLRKADWWPG